MNDIENQEKAKVPTLQFEAVKTSMMQDKNGTNIRLTIHPDDVPQELHKDWVGSRYMVVMVKLNDVIIYKSQGNYLQDKTLATENMINLFIPRQSKVEVISINTTQNNTQIRGVNVLGYYL